MYEAFGFSRWPDGRLGFKLFIPDHAIDSTQYQRGGPSRIVSVRVYGTFQQQAWDEASALGLSLEPHAHGLLFALPLPPHTADGFYEYKYLVEFENGEVRKIGDPCTKYSGYTNDNSAFVVGGSPLQVTGLDPELRRSGSDLIVYELMLEDFTQGFRGRRSPVEALADKLPYLKSLNINAIEFMPWISWPDAHGFSWGYDPAFYFAVEARLVCAHETSLERLSKLARMVSACHQQGLMVILDIVLQHAHQGEPHQGFPYYWLWQNPEDSPFVGQFTDADPFGNVPLDYNNACTLEFVADVCRYWAETFSVDGFRFDQVSGFYNPSRRQKGAPALIRKLNEFLRARHLDGHFPLILEDSWDDEARVHANAMKATHAWYVPYQASMASLLGSDKHPGPWFMKLLNAAEGFNFPISPVVYLESHDQPTITNFAGGREQWYKVQPYAIALATSPGSIMLGQGQEFGRSEWLPDDDQGLPADQQRINPRPLRWNESEDAVGQQLRRLYTHLLKIRQEHSGLRSPHFYPDVYQEEWTEFNPQGYGVHEGLGVVIYHRFGDDQRFIVALNFSDQAATVDIPFPASGRWIDLLGGQEYQVEDYWLRSHELSSHWGRIFQEAI